MQSKDDAYWAEINRQSLAKNSQFKQNDNRPSYSAYALSSQLNSANQNNYLAQSQENKIMNPHNQNNSMNPYNQKNYQFPQNQNNFINPNHIYQFQNNQFYQNNVYKNLVNNQQHKSPYLLAQNRNKNKIKKKHKKRQNQGLNYRRNQRRNNNNSCVKMIISFLGVCGFVAFVLVMTLKR